MNATVTEVAKSDVPDAVPPDVVLDVIRTAAKGTEVIPAEHSGLPGAGAAQVSPRSTLRGPRDVRMRVEAGRQGEGTMSGVRVLVGTQKGAFVMTSDGRRADWEVTGPHFGGWEIYHVVGAPSDPMRVYASQSTGWFGQIIQRSDDGGQSWRPVGNGFAYDGTLGTHQWYDGTPHPWEFAARLAPRALADRSRHGVRRRRGRRAVQVDRRRDDLGRTVWAAYAQHRAVLAARRGGHVRPYGPGRPDRPRTPPRGHLRSRGVPQRRRGSRPGSRPTVASVRRGSPTLTPRSVTVSTGSRGTRRDPMCCSCRSTGT